MTKLRDFNLEILENDIPRNCGLYRDVLLDMANYLRENKKLQEALLTYLQVSFLAANERKKSGGKSEPKILNLFPAFNPSAGIQETEILGKIDQLSHELEISNTDLQEQYLDVASRLHKNIKTPVNPEDAWNEFRKELEEYSKKIVWNGT
jgi:hypothetical protein